MLKNRQPSFPDQLRRTLETAARQAALCGEFAGSCASWKTPSWKLMVFVSSTFTDTAAERNIIIEKIQPRLKQIGRPLSIQVVFVDMRWGVRDENTLEHRTWIECARELDNCQAESMGVFFLSLQSYKYGYMPIPPFVDQILFETRFTAASSADKEIASKWYNLDANSDPPQYRLRNLSSLDDKEYWCVALPTLRNMLEDLPMEPVRCDKLLIARSVTDWEVTTALLTSRRVKDMLWFHRAFTDGISEALDPRSLYWDARDPDTLNKYNNLKSFMLSNFLPDNIVNFNSTSHASYVAGNSGAKADYMSYIMEWEKNAEYRLSSSLHDIVSQRMSWDTDGNGMGIPGESLGEMLHHCKLASDKSTLFFSCDEHLANAIDILMSPSRLVNADEPNPLSCVSLCITGTCGTGKSALMAKIAAELYAKQQSGEIGSAIRKRPIIIRFCGTSRDSIEGLDLVLSVCFQIESVLGIDSESSDLQTYDMAVFRLEKLLRTHPIALFLDGIDQLSDSNQASSRLSFLRHILPHEHTRIVLSADAEPSSVCGTLLSTSGCPSITLSENGDTTTFNHACKIMESLLSAQHRKLTSSQWEYVRDKIKDEPTPLYVVFAVSIASKWPSFISPFDGAPSGCSLQSGVDGIINQVIDTIELSYGTKLARAAIGFITFSVNGVNDDEMVDLLSLSDNVLDSVFQYSKAESPRLPTHVWLRLRAELKIFLAVRNQNCMVWNHRLIKLAVQKRYSSEEQESCHRLMALYFGNLLDSSIISERGLLTQPMLLSGDGEIHFLSEESKVNVRRCDEAAQQMLFLGTVEMLTACKNELCSICSICCRLRAKKLNQMIDELVRLNNAFRSLQKTTDQCVSDYLSCLLLYGYNIAEDPIRQVVAYASFQPKMSFVRRDALQLLESVTLRNQPVDFADLRERKNESSNYWICCEVVEGQVEHENLKICFGEKLFSDRSKDFVLDDAGVDHLAWSPDGAYLALSYLKSNKSTYLERVYGSTWFFQDIVVLNSATCRVEMKLSWDQPLKFRGSSRIYGLAWCSDGNRLASCDRSKCWSENSHNIRLWNVKSANNYLSWEAPEVDAILWSGDGARIYSASTHHTNLCVWNTFDGELMFIVNIGTTDFGPISCVRWGPCGKFVAVGYEDGNVRIWSTAEGVSELLNLVASRDVKKIRHLYWQIESKYLAVVVEYGDAVRIWNIEDQQWVANGLPESGCQGASSLDWYPVSSSALRNTIVTCNYEGLIRVWDGASACLIATVANKIDRLFSCVRWCPCTSDGIRVAAGSGDNAVRIYACPDLLLNSTLQVDEENSTSSSFSQLEGVNWLNWSPIDNNHVFSASRTFIRIYDITSRRIEKEIGCFGTPNAVFVGRNDDNPFKLVFKVATPLYMTNRIGVHNFIDGTVLHSDGVSHPSSIRIIAWSPSGQFVTSVSEDSSMFVWRVSEAAMSLHCVFPLAHEKPVWSLIWSSDSKKIASRSVCGFVSVAYIGERGCDDHTDKGIKRIQLPSKDADSGITSNMSWNPDGTRICCVLRGQDDNICILYSSGERKTLYVNDKYSHQHDTEMSISSGIYYTSSAWHVNGVILATAYNSFFCRIWDTDSCNLIATIESVSNAHICVLSWRSPNCIAGIESNWSLHIWNIHDISHCQNPISPSVDEIGVTIPCFDSPPGFKELNGVIPRMVTSNKRFRPFYLACMHSIVKKSTVLLDPSICPEVSLMYYHKMDKPLHLLKKLSSTAGGNATVRYALAVHFSSILNDSGEANKWFQLAADQGHLESQLILAEHHISEQKCSLALKYLQSAAERGNAGAAAIIGSWYYQGIYVAKDLLESLKYLQQAACQFSSMATMELVNIQTQLLATGDFDKAALYCSALGKLMHVPSQMMLAQMYQSGLGVAVDLGQSFFWYQKAASSGCLDAIHIVGLCYAHGLGVVQDDALAAQHWKLAADQGHIASILQLGQCYLSGQFVEQNTELGNKLLQIGSSCLNQE